jgi:type I restriction enzyme S subunit
MIRYLATVRPGNRTFYYFKTAFENSIASTGFAVLRPKADITDPRFLYYLVSEPGFTAYLVAYEQGANYPAVNPEIIGGKRIEFPPLQTQRRIASILSAYDDLIENNLRRIKLLEEKAFAGYKLLVKSEKFKLEELFDTSSGGTPSRTNAEYFTGEINWFKSKELADSILLESEEKITEQAVDKSSAKLFPAGSVIMAMYGATIGKLGLLSQPSTTNQACCAIIQKDEIASNYYILNWLIENREYVLSFRMGAAQENISQQVIRNLLVSIPKVRDLKIFNQEMKPIYQLIKNLHQQNTKLREARDIFLPRLMSGEIAV